jgi:hypothetical protein
LIATCPPRIMADHNTERAAVANEEHMEPLEQGGAVDRLITLLHKILKNAFATRVTRIELAFLGAAALCLLPLLTPDSVLLVKRGWFFRFVLLGSAVLIALRVYLQMSVVQAPTLLLLSPMRLLNWLIFYFLLPLIIMFLAWKTAVFPAWGSALFSVGAGVIASHIMLPLSKFSWLPRILLSVGAGIVAFGVIFWWVIFGFGLSPSRPFNLSNAHLSGANLNEAYLENAHLSGAYLSGVNLSSANLHGANLSNAHLIGANLNGANLIDANLSNAFLVDANLSGAFLRSATLTRVNLGGANLSGANLLGAFLGYADLTRANLSGANLSHAYLLGASSLTQLQLNEACGDATTKLPDDLRIEPCS